MDALDHERSTKETEEEVELYLYPIKEKWRRRKYHRRTILDSLLASSSTTNSFDLVNTNVTSRGKPLMAWFYLYRRWKSS